MKTSKKRIFLGIPISSKNKERIKRWQRENLSGLPLRKVAVKNLHLTLVPPWYETNINKLINVFEKSKIFVKPFIVNFRQIEPGPLAKRPRLIWITGKKSENLNNLKKSFEKLLNKKPEKREFLPHLTIARFREKDFPQLAGKKLRERINWIEKVDKIAIFESKLSPKGADYSVIKTFALR